MHTQHTTPLAVCASRQQKNYDPESLIDAIYNAIEPYIKPLNSGTRLCIEGFIALEVYADYRKRESA